MAFLFISDDILHSLPELDLSNLLRVGQFECQIPCAKSYDLLRVVIVFAQVKFILEVFSDLLSNGRYHSGPSDHDDALNFIL